MKFSIEEIRNWIICSGFNEDGYLCTSLSEEKMLAANPELKTDVPSIEIIEEDLDKTTTIFNRIGENMDHPKFDAAGNTINGLIKIYVDTSDIPNKYDPDVPLGGYED